jgi:hypothetical protein
MGATPDFIVVEFGKCERRCTTKGADADLAAINDADYPITPPYGGERYTRDSVSGLV